MISSKHLLKYFLRLIGIGLTLTFSTQSQADFGEIDLLVRESIATHFRDYGRAVDLRKLSYTSKPKLNGKILSVYTSVWAEQRLIKPNWGWHECTTELELKDSGVYIDKGSDCFFEFD